MRVCGHVGIGPGVVWSWRACVIPRYGKTPRRHARCGYAMKGCCWVVGFGVSTGRDVQDAGPGDGGRGRIFEVTNLEDHAHVWLERDALVRGEGEDAVVVHDAVHALNPVRVEVAVQHDPLRQLVVDLTEITHDRREHPVLPLARGQGHITVEVARAHHLGVEVDNRDGLNLSTALGGVSQGQVRVPEAPRLT